MQKTYYKVVRIKKDGRRVSCWPAVEKAGVALEYPPNTRVEAHFMSMGIFVFKTLEDAEDFVYANSSVDREFKIIRCHGHGRMRNYKRMPLPSPRNIKIYFYKKSWCNEDIFTISTQFGSVCFPAITTLE